MADVQLEHGHLRIANALFDALLRSPLSGVQLRIVLALIRDTYGWQRTQSDAPRAELFTLAGVSDSSTTRAALHALIAEGVLLVTVEHAGRRAGRLSLNKNYDGWGAYCPAETAAQDTPVVRRKTPHNPTGGNRRTRENRRTNPAETAGQESRNSFSGETCALSKDRKDKEEGSSVGKAPLASSSVAAAAAEFLAPAVVGTIVPDSGLYQIGIASAANEAAAAKFGESLDVIVWNDTRTVDAAEQMRAAGVPLDHAREVITAKVMAMPERPYSARYFTQAVVASWRAATTPALGTIRMVAGGKRQPQRFTYDTSGNDAAVAELRRLNPGLEGNPDEF